MVQDENLYLHTQNKGNKRRTSRKQELGLQRLSYCLTGEDLGGEGIK